MKFVELHEHIPLARYGKPKSLTMEPYKGITLAMPGRHAEDTSPKGGDFVVMVTDPSVGWKRHQFKHDDIFNDVEAKAEAADTVARKMDIAGFMQEYLNVIAIGREPDKKLVQPDWLKHTIHPVIFLHAIQCLAVAEHRRYHQHEPRFGGRFLPFRFAAGIAEGLWTAHDAIQKQRFGRPAVERLERDKGVPVLTQRLFDTAP